MGLIGQGKFFFNRVNELQEE